MALMIELESKILEEGKFKIQSRYERPSKQSLDCHSPKKSSKRFFIKNLLVVSTN